MTSHRILITAEYLNVHFISVFLSVYALQDCVKALFYANFPKFGWKVEWSGLFCATMYSPGGCSSLTMMLNHLRSDVVSFATFVICIVSKSNLMDSAGFHVARKIIAAVQIHRMPLQSSTIAHKLSVSWLQQRQQVINWVEYECAVSHSRPILTFWPPMWPRLAQQAISNATLGSHRTQLNWTLPHARNWARFENGRQKFGACPKTRGPKLPIFWWFYDNIAIWARISSKRNAP